MRSCTFILVIIFLFQLASDAASAQELRPNDPGFADQWALEQVGAPCAWARTTGSAEVTVAVVDSGVDMGHPDLVGRLRDDGRDFVDGDDDPSDENGHGTNVAGVIAATLDNAEGVAGLAPGVTILPVRVMNHKGFGSDRSIARGIRFAADSGAQVINLSLGATLMIGADTESEQVTSAIRYAQEHGALVVVAAGNDFVPLPNAIVGDNPDVLVVAATDPDDRKADFSNSGPWVNIAAPGVQILSTMPTYEVYLTGPEVPRDERFREGYDYMSGTSQAAPLVSALAALLFSAHPEWDASQVAQHIRETAADISRLNRDVELGGGRIDACLALGDVPAAADPTAPPVADTPDTPDPPGGPAIPSGDASARPGVRGLSTSLAAVAALTCGVVLLLSALLLAIGWLARRGAPAGPRRPAPVPVYAPPPPPAPAPQTPFPPAPHAPPDASPGWGALTVVAGPSQQRAYTLAGPATLIGRDADCAVALIGDGTVSRRHAVVRNDGRRVTVEDAGSSHGTYLNGAYVTGPTPVHRGDVLQVGQTLLRFG
jgi:type VII secretion-associated serine protease mycosin